MKLKHFIFIFVFTIIPFTNTFASVMVSPQYVILEGRDRTENILIANTTSKTKTYRVSLINYTQEADGSYKPAKTPAQGEHFADDVILYGPRQVTLAPKKSQTVRIQKRFSPNSPDGEYRSHLLFQEIPEELPAMSSSETKGLKIQLQAIYGISIPVVIRKGNLQASTQLTNLQSTHTKDNKPAVKFTIKREGNKSVRGNIRVKKGSDVIGELNGVAVYLSTDKRLVMVPLYKDVRAGLAMDWHDGRR